MRNVDFSKLKFNHVAIRNDLLLAREQIVKPILAVAGRKGYCSQDLFAVRLALEEAVNNAYKHGNCRDPEKTIRVKWAVDRHAVVICVADEGGGFDPAKVPDPRTDENREKPSGRGLMLMKAYMSDLDFNRKGNEVRMVKVRQKTGLAPVG